MFLPDFERNHLMKLTRLCKIRRKVEINIEFLPFSAWEIYEHTMADFANQILLL